MAYQIVLSDEEYAALTAASTRSGEPIEQLVHDAIMSHYPMLPPASRHGQIDDYLYPTGEPDTPAEEAEDEELATSIGPGRPISEILLDERGPR